MRILALDQYSDPGGAQRVLLDALTAFRDRGWQAMAALAGRGPMHNSIKTLGFLTATLTCGPYTSGRKGLRDWLRFAADLPAAVRQISRLIADFSPDLLYVNGPRLMPAIGLLRAPLPVVFHSHSYLPPGPVRTLTAAALRRCDAHVIANCRAIAAQWTPLEAEVIYNGVPGPSQSSPRLPHPPSIGCIGRISPEKGQLAFLAVARLIHRELPEARFVIAGAPLFENPDSSRYVDLVRAAATGLPVGFTGWVDDAYDVLAELDLLLVPSSPDEATTRVIPEAWAARVPVIAFPSRGISEIVHHGRNGFLAQSPAGMADLALAVLRDPEQLRRVISGGYEAWSRDFTPGRFADQLMRSLTGRTAGSATTIAHQTRPGEANS